MQNANAVVEDTKTTMVKEKPNQKIQFKPHGTITPNSYVGAYQGMGRQGLEFWSAISELVDNTLTVDGQTICQVTVDRKNGTVTIQDNSIGIKGVDLEGGQMMSIGKPVNAGRQLLSYSGVGMKAALYFLGNEWEIITKPDTEDKVYKLKPNFNTRTDNGGKQADFDLSVSDDTERPTGTKIIIKDLNVLPKTMQTEDVTVQMLRATYADYLESGKLTLRLIFIPEGKRGKTNTYNLTPLRPLLSNDLNVLDADSLIGANEPKATGTLKSDSEDTHLDWEIDIKAGWKLHPTNAMEYYGKTNPALVHDNYGTRGGTKPNSPYAWGGDTGGVNFKTTGIGGTDMGGKILLFNKLQASSRKEGLWVEVTLKKGIEPTMVKNDMKKDANFKDMEEKLKVWLEENDFRSRVKAGHLHLGEAKHVRDKFVEHLRQDSLLRQSWGISLDTFDQQVITENELSGGRVDVGVLGDYKTVAVECKKEVISGQDVSQGAGYALDMGADLLVMVAQKMTPTGAHMQTLWKDKLGIDIVFFNIADLYTKS
tara:strand:+ start:1412 stop:3025 length:1614 start_codon:yes stop_codon:yes gene_type:complete